MAYDDRSLDNYIDVAQRIADFRERHPEGSLEPLNPAESYRIERVPAFWCIRCKGKRAIKDGAWKKCPRCEGNGLRAEGEPLEDVFIVYTCAAYRTPDDQRPGIGVAWEPYPGQTPYTAASELMNAETSAQGRAIVAALASDSKRGVSSREEVRNRRAEQEDHDLGPPPGPRPLADLPRNRDGSVSVSRCTEEELELYGFLRGEKRAEHNALRNGADGKLPKDEAAKVGVCSPGNPCADADCPQCTPDADLWATDADYTPADDLRLGEPSPPLRRPRKARTLPEQISAEFTRLGITDRDVRLGITARLAGTGRLSSSKNLNVTQARKVLKAVSMCEDQAALREHLDSNQEVMTDA